MRRSIVPVFLVIALVSGCAAAKPSPPAAPEAPPRESPITISGPASVNEERTASYTATATWSDGATSDITYLASWTTTLGTISGSGVLTAPSVAEDQTATLSASYPMAGVPRTTSVSVTIVNVSPMPATRPPPVSPADKAFADGMTAIREGSHERALELFSAAWKEKPGHPGVSEEFDGTLVALKKSGDQAYAQGKTEDAGKRWMGTLRYMSHPAAKPKNYPFTRADVQAQVDRLTAGLMEKGLLDYRKGNIEAAIASWKTILAYDPGNEEALKSIRTATTQLENLKKIPPGK